MQAVFGLNCQAFIVLGILCLGYMLHECVAMTTHRLEKMVRAIAVVTGIFLYGAAKAYMHNGVAGLLLHRKS